MSGRHRKPTHTGLRLARVGALTMMAMTPLGMAGTAFAATPDSDPDSWSSEDPGSSGVSGSDEGSRHVRSDPGEDAATLHSFDWREADAPRAKHRASDSDSDSTPSRATRAADSTPSRTTRALDSTPSRATRAADATPARTTRASDTTTSAVAPSKWDKLAECESTRNWSANTGSGYKGGLQFSDATWRAYGGRQYATSADQASRAEQIAVAEKVRQAQGWNAWPGCSRKLGYS